MYLPAGLALCGVGCCLILGFIWMDLHGFRISCADCLRLWLVVAVVIKLDFGIGC